MDTIFESNKFNTLEIEQGGYNKWRLICSKKQKQNPSYSISVKNSRKLQQPPPGLSQSPTKPLHYGNAPRERQAVKTSGFVARGGSLRWS